MTNSIYLRMAKDVIERIRTSNGIYINNDEDDFSFLEGRTFRIETGASKIVIVSDYFPYVVKIPCNGHAEDSYKCCIDNSIYCESCGECGDYECVSERHFEDFTGAQLTKEGWNYCDTEVILYEKAEEADVADFFLPNHLIGEVDGHPIYIQKKIQVGLGDSEPSKNSLDYVKTHEEIADYLPNLFSALFLDYYEDEGKLYLELLARFVKKNGISDLHGGNYGFVNGRPYISDYAGFDS